MADVLEALKSLQSSQTRLTAEVEAVSHRLDSLGPSAPGTALEDITGRTTPQAPGAVAASSALRTPSAASAEPESEASSAPTNAAAQAQKSGFTSRIILT
jgi:hypothetical protein